MLAAVRDRRLPGYLAPPRRRRRSAPVDAGRGRAAAAAGRHHRPRGAGDGSSTPRAAARAGAGPDDVAVLAGLSVHRLGAAPRAAPPARRRRAAVRHDRLGQEPGRRERAAASSASTPAPAARRPRAARSRTPRCSSSPASSSPTSTAACSPSTSPGPDASSWAPRSPSVGAATLRAGRAADRARPRWSRLVAERRRVGAPAARRGAARRPRDRGRRTRRAADPGGAVAEVVAGTCAAGDIVLADQGTAFYGMAPHRLPARRHLRRPAAVGVDRLHAAGAARGLHRAARAPRRAADRRRGRADDGAGAGHGPARSGSRR